MNSHSLSFARCFVFPLFRGPVSLSSGNADLPDANGNTALHLAVTNGHIEAVTFLVNFGVNLWALTNHRKTARDLAVNCNIILQLLDSEMSHCQLLHPNKVKKLQEKASNQLERRLKLINKLNGKMSKCNKINNNNSINNDNKCHLRNDSDTESRCKHSNTKHSFHGTLNSLSRRTLSAIEMKFDSMLSRSSRCASFSPVRSSTSSLATESSSVTSRFYDRLFHRSSVKSQCSSSSSSSVSKKSSKHWYSRKHVQDECYSDDEKVIGQRYQQRHQQEQECEGRGGEEEGEDEEGEQFTSPRYHQSMVSLSRYSSSSDRKAMVNDTIYCERVNNDQERTLVESINDKCNIKCTRVLASSDTERRHGGDSRQINRVNCTSYNGMASFSSVTCLTSKCCNDILFAPRGTRVKMKSIATTATNILDTNNALSSNVSIAPNSTLRFKASPWLHVFQQ